VFRGVGEKKLHGGWSREKGELEVSPCRKNLDAMTSRRSPEKEKLKFRKEKGS